MTRIPKRTATFVVAGALCAAALAASCARNAPAGSTDIESADDVARVAHREQAAVLRRLMAVYQGVTARLLIGDERVSDNPKLNNVVKGWRSAAFDWIVIADSNVLMPRDYVQRLLAAMARPATGLVCSPPVGCSPDGVWAELECGFLNTYQARWQYAADSIGMGFAQGKTMLWRRDILEAGGGIRALGAELAEDAAATKLVRNMGLCVRLVDAPRILGDRRGHADPPERLLDRPEVPAPVIDDGDHRLASPAAAARTAAMAITTRPSSRAGSR